ncbi:hypothetical protein FM110_11025 [Brachybacterium nesterenkovii]|uniref:Uncharacterized protein n=1 Tax=Brachybacterium nesterenkovii TaxID=47847 RepID=A0A1X6X5E0_9MICO|nr:hypothetical protein FM110_11025 [Brachybacterium nesterenkovii]
MGAGHARHGGGGGAPGPRADDRTVGRPRSPRVRIGVVSGADRAGS